MKNQIPKKKANRINSLKTNMTICFTIQIRVTMNISGIRWSISHHMWNKLDLMISKQKKIKLNEIKIRAVDL